jgi:2-keto-4-pentenoate hydratase/2-oxohepta-3-ene-1,7-dioic acid hydratase in catechol pathway
VLFQKPASAVIAHGEAIVLPGISKMVLYEGELAIVIGAQGKNLTEAAALQIVAGYTIANDIGAADIEARSSQWASGKMFDTFCPLGPNLVLKKDVENPERLTIRTWLNDQLVQDGRTSQMIFGVSFLVSYISQLTTLKPGDVILTGSPKCLGAEPDPRIPLRPGDEISIEIEGLGRLSNPVVSEEQADE